MTDDQLQLVDVLERLVDRFSQSAEESGRKVADALEGHMPSPYPFTDRCATVADGLMAIASALESIAEKMPETRKPKFEAEEDQDPMGLKPKKGGRSWN